MRRPDLVALAACAMMWSAAASAGDVEAGKSKAAACATCHGTAGAAPTANFPVLAGQHENYLKHAMTAYRDGKRENAVMTAQMAGMSDEDIADLAAYFAAQTGSLR